jgi:hypothetical protein
VASAGIKKTDPASVLPIAQIPAAYRDQVAEVVAEHTLHRRGKSDAFPCNKYLYLCLLNEPALTLALWKDLGDSPAQLNQIGPDSYQGLDGAGTVARWDYLLRTPELHVMFADIEYTSPRTGSKLRGRLVMLMRISFSSRAGGEQWVHHELEAFVKIDSLGWKAVATTVRPIVERVLEEQLQEAGWFVSLMGRLVETYPVWAIQVAAGETGVRSDLKENFRKIVVQYRKPGSSSGRPTRIASEPVTPRR